MKVIIIFPKKYQCFAIAITIGKETLKSLRVILNILNTFKSYYFIQVIFIIFVLPNDYYCIKISTCFFDIRDNTFEGSKKKAFLIKTQANIYVAINLPFTHSAHSLLTPQHVAVLKAILTGFLPFFHNNAKKMEPVTALITMERLTQ